MTTKQEKLAAARRKLKEFQGKNKGAESSRHKDVNESLPFKSIEDSTHTSTESSPRNTLLLDESKNSKSNKTDIPGYNVSKSGDKRKPLEESRSPRKLSDSFSNKSNSPIHCLGGNQSLYDSSNQNIVSEIYKSEKTSTENVESHVDSNNGYQYVNNISINNSSSDENKKTPERLTPEQNYQNNSVSFPEVNTYSDLKEPKEFFNNDFISSSAFNDLVKPLQVELQNHAQTITILVQQRNDAQNALTEAQNLLTQKAGEVKELKQYVTFLTSSVNNLNQKLTEEEKIKQNLHLENEQTVQKSNTIRSKFDSLQTQLDSKEEEYLELKRKYEEKNKESQHLLLSLNEAQSQLALYQIQIQQFSTGENSGLNVHISDLQNENFNLRQKIEELGKKLEAANVEKEQSSQNFHVYAQQCNSQLNDLKSQLKTLTIENENLKQETSVFSKSSSDVENVKETDLSLETFKTEIADLHTQISVLMEANNELQSDLKKKEDNLIDVYKQMEKKSEEFKNLEALLEDLEAENKKLLYEVDTPKANERLLAAMESDKVAAAKAVSQNQKLKEQIVEFEKALMKLNEEKLELTDQLAHEKHINKELRSHLENLEPHHQDHHSHNEHCEGKENQANHENHDQHEHHDHHDHHDHSECYRHLETNEKLEPLVNDSNEIEELRRIIRQLQDDKVELKARLNSFIPNKTVFNEENSDEKLKNEHKQDGTQCEDTKFLLQQLEEKVKKTMNEIAILDEEKEKLEHLVLQLQGETETIGEYITLYQTQRMLLRQRAQEKDNQLVQLSKDKEELRYKLAALDQLVQHLVAERENINLQSDQSTLNSPPVEVPENTAVKIRELINEIGSTTLVSKSSVAFEHYSCCSGKVITI